MIINVDAPSLPPLGFLPWIDSRRQVWEVPWNHENLTEDLVCMEGIKNKKRFDRSGLRRVDRQLPSR
jgi:hypothetical protein